MTKPRPILVVVGVVMQCDRRVRVRVHVSRSCATENTYTSARLEALLELSIVIIRTHLHEFRLVVGVLFGEILLSEKS